MSNYHTQALASADIFTIMGSIYAEVARYDSAIATNRPQQAVQAIERAQEIIDFSQSLGQITSAQKQEVKTFSNVLAKRTTKSYKTNLDDYLLPFAIAARMRQFK